jgi:hypothetical protein
VARTPLPDILYDPKRPAAYPDNGRTLSDDVTDVFISILTNGKVTGDKVGPHQRPARLVPLRRHSAHGPICRIGAARKGGY